MDVARKRRRAYAAALGLAALAASKEGAARGATEVATRLQYSATSGCPTVGDFEAIVTERLRYDPFRPDASDQVIVRIEAAGRRLEGRLEWRDAGGTSMGEHAFPSRTGDCAELTHAMGFALALQIRFLETTTMAMLSAQRKTPVPTGIAATETPAPKPMIVVAPALEIASIAREETTARVRWRGPSIAVGAGASAGVGLSSSPVALGRIFGTVGWSHAAVEFAVEASTPSVTHRGDGSGFSQQEFLASLAGCGVHGPWNACLVAKVGEMRVVGQGVDVPLTSVGLIAQTGLRVAVSHAFNRRTYILLHAEGLAQLIGGAVTLDSTVIWTTPRVAGTIGVDFGLRFR